MSPEDLPVAEFAFPGPLRDQLVAAIVAGDKTTTTGHEQFWHSADMRNALSDGTLVVAQTFRLAGN